MDVDEFISEVTPEQLNGWMEMENICPFGDEKIAWVLATGFAMLINVTLATAMTMNDVKEIVKPSDFIPWKRKKKQRRKYVSPNESAAAFKKMMGQ